MRIKKSKILVTKIVLMFLSIFILKCNENSVEPKFQPINIDVRMEVQVLDSTYHFYKRPFTQIYFTTYKLTSNNEKVELLQSDTTSCRNGWGVKLLNFTFNNSNEKIILGASCENYNGNNYREEEISYNEIEYRIDESNYVSITKTFAIYYK
ncbi:MAG: hypothetical protein IPM32_14870 [Ignavibacteriae bacterium]|nr:hypothetical protein [Ignavibacteriota bacterium]